MWMVTFADLMALLLTLFVLLLTFSEMDVIRYKKIAGSLSQSFGFAPQDRLAGLIDLEGSLLNKALKPLQQQSPEIVTELPPPAEPQYEPDEIEVSDEDGESQAEQRAQALETALGQMLERLPGGEVLEVERSGETVVIRFPSNIAFASGAAEIEPDFAALLERLTPILARTDGDIAVSGFTDDVPLAGGGRYRSNWDLSAARATSVAHFLLSHDAIAPQNLTVQGYGESRPLVPNDSRENRARNRRVEIAISQRDPNAPAPDFSGFEDP